MSETLHIQTFTEPMIGENAYVISVVDGDRRPAWIIDPGLGKQGEDLLAYIAAENIHLEKILLTHGHVDHIAGLDIVRSAQPQAEILIADQDRPMLSSAELNMSAPFGMPMTVESEADGDLPAGLELRLGATIWQVLDTSGHSPGGRSFYCPEAGVVFTGDALFAGSIGRTDITGADMNQLLTRLRDNLLTLPDETVVFSGHGPTTTIGNERKSNPFLADR